MNKNKIKLKKDVDKNSESTVNALDTVKKSQEAKKSRRTQSMSWKEEKKKEENRKEGGDNSKHQTLDNFERKAKIPIFSRTRPSINNDLNLAMKQTSFDGSSSKLFDKSE